jgi:Chloramphenicol phosphotransferase-like protein
VDECAELFHELNAYLVGVRCPLEVVEERERSRKDRTLDQARAQYKAVHQYCKYVLEVDTSFLFAQLCAEKINDFLGNEPPQLAFSKSKKSDFHHSFENFHKGIIIPLCL